MLTKPAPAGQVVTKLVPPAIATKTFWKLLVGARLLAALAGFSGGMLFSVGMFVEQEAKVWTESGWSLLVGATSLFGLGSVITVALSVRLANKHG